MYKATVTPAPELSDADQDVLADAVKRAAYSLGADLVGIADPAYFDSEPANQRPQTIFPEVSRIVLIGRRITRGSVRGIEEGTNWQSYDYFGKQWLEDQYLSRTVFEVVGYLEDIGYEAVPLFGYPPDMPEMGIPLREGQPGPNVHCDPRLAAIAAGLGTVGRLGEFLSPEFGSLQKLSMILTDAPMRADAPKDFSFCTDCTDCVDACPLDAPETLEVHQYGEISWEEYRFKTLRCETCQNGAQQCRFVGSRAVERIPAACGRACIASLERRGMLNRRFHNPFRKRTPWAINRYGEVDPGDR